MGNCTGIPKDGADPDMSHYTNRSSQNGAIPHSQETISTSRPESIPHSQDHNATDQPELIIHEKFEAELAAKLGKFLVPVSFTNLLKLTVVMKQRIETARASIRLRKLANGSRHSLLKSSQRGLVWSPSIAPHIDPETDYINGNDVEYESSKESKLIENGKELINQRLTSLGIRPVKMGDDGNCQFRALSFQLFGKQDYHYYVRQRVVQYMKRNSEIFKPFFAADSESVSEYELYLRNMARDKTWGDELTMKAAAEEFSSCIHIITSEKENWYLRYNPEHIPEENVKKQIFVTYISPIHYNSVSMDDK